MTTYQHTLTVGDSEFMALSAALELMIEHCNQRLKAGEGAPYWAHRQSCTNVLSRLKSGPATMTSTSTFR
jgi:hypothetical protein